MASPAFLTAYKIGASSGQLSDPKIVQIPTDQIKDIKKVPSTVTDDRWIAGTTRVFTTDVNGVYGVYESPEQIRAAIDPASTDLYIKGQVDSAKAAHGSAAAGGLALVKYFTEITTATATSSDGVTLPTAVANKVMVVQNNTAVALEAWPNNASDTISGDSGPIAIAAYTRKHFVAEDAVNWVVAS